MTVAFKNHSHPHNLYARPIQVVQQWRSNYDSSNWPNLQKVQNKKDNQELETYLPEEASKGEVDARVSPKRV